MSLVIGLTGPNAAGKGEVASYLRRKGFQVHSLSDIVREAAADLGLPPEREHLIVVGNRLRREGGPGVLAERVLTRLGQRDVVDSIRNPSEVAVLRHLPRFCLLGVDAPTDRRFHRSLARARPGDPRTLQEFEERERQENAEDPLAQQLRETFKLCDRVVQNDAGLEMLHARIDRILEEIDG